MLQSNPPHRSFQILFHGVLLFAAISLFASAQRPNIVLIFVDDLGYGDLGCYGSEEIATPHLDRLAAQGMRLTDGYVVSPVCGPSRVGLLTGAYPQRFGVYWNPDTTRAEIPPSYQILPEAMRAAGYATAIVGKWNITRDVHQSADIVRDPMIWGGDYWPRADGTYGGVGGGWGDSKEQGLWGPEEPGDEYLTDRLSQHAVHFITSHQEEPFFLYLAYNAPHSPLHAHRRYAEAVAHLENEPLRIYAAMVMAMDTGVGRILDTLASSGLEQNTLVIFLSDNGPAKGSFKGYKAEWPKQVLGSTDRLRGQKGSHREGGIRIPFVMKWPGKISAGTESDHPVVSLDLFPTLLHVAGQKPSANPHVDGADLLPWLTGTAAAPTPRPLFWANDNERAVRLGDWKLYSDQPDAWQLYNLRTDRNEAHDVAPDHPEVVERLDALFSAWIAQMPKHTDRTQPPILHPEDPVPLVPVLPLQ